MELSAVLVVLHSPSCFDLLVCLSFPPLALFTNFKFEQCQLRCNDVLPNNKLIELLSRGTQRKQAEEGSKTSTQKILQFTHASTITPEPDSLPKNQQ